MKTTKRETTTKMVKFSTRLSDKLVEEVQIRAIREKLTLQELVGAALAAYLKTPLGRKEGDR
jgi:hypothetical protein